MAIAGSAIAAPAEITIVDENVFPESVTATEDGTVIVGSLIQPFIYRAKKGATIASRWIDLTGVNSVSYGVLADVKTQTLWTCTVVNPVPFRRLPSPSARRSTLRAFDLDSGAPKGAWPLPGEANSCNDVTVGPDGTAYVSDIGNGRIVQLKAGAVAMEIWYSGPETGTVDGIAFIGPKLYFNHLRTDD
jgi:hypothetical protein